MQEMRNCVYRVDYNRLEYFIVSVRCEVYVVVAHAILDHWDLHREPIQSRRCLLVLPNANNSRPTMRLCFSLGSMVDHLVYWNRPSQGLYNCL